MPYLGSLTIQPEDTMARYDRDSRGYDRGPYTAWYPGAYWAGAPMFGWGGFGWPPYAPIGYGAFDRGRLPRRPPRESRTYGRGGDEAARRWARERGYDADFAIRPHPAEQRWHRGRRGYGR